MRQNTRIADSRIARVIANDDGMTTAEYAVGTVAAAGLGGILIKILSSDAVRELIFNAIKGAFSALFGG